MLTTSIVRRRRQLAIERLGLMERGNDDRFDDLAMLAAFVCGTPVAAVNILDSWTQHTVGMYGATSSDMPITSVPCRYVVDSVDRTALHVPNISEDDRLRDLRGVQEWQLQSYTGAPIIATDGAIIGSLCVVDFAPNALAEGQLEFLECLARVVARELEAHTAPVFQASVLPAMPEVHAALAETRYDEERVIETWIDQSGGWGSLSHSARIRLAAHLPLHESVQAHWLDLQASEITDLSSVLSGAFVDVPDTHRLVIRMGEPAIVHGKRRLIESALVELIDNAVKFSPRGGTVSLDVNVVGDDVVVRVSDSGMGIPVNEDVFVPMVRGVNAKGFPGEGIGLSVVHDVMASCGGTVAAWSTPWGSTVGLLFQKA